MVSILCMLCVPIITHLLKYRVSYNLCKKEGGCEPKRRSLFKFRKNKLKSKLERKVGKFC